MALKGCSGRRGGGGGRGRGGSGFVAVRHVSGQFGHAHFRPHGVADMFEHSPGAAVRVPDPLQMAQERGHGLRLAVAHELQLLPHTRVEQHGGAATGSGAGTFAASAVDALATSSATRIIATRATTRTVVALPCTAFQRVLHSNSA